MTIICDVDGVVADLYSEWCRRYNSDFDDELKPDQITDWDISRFVKRQCGRRIYDYLKDGTIYDHVEPVAGAAEGVHSLREMGHRVVFASSCVRGTLDFKVDWLVRWGFLPHAQSKDFVAIHDKILLNGDLLIDDSPRFIIGWLLHRHQPAIVFDRSWNRDLVVVAPRGAQLIRVVQWHEIVPYVRGDYSIIPDSRPQTRVS